MPDIPVPSAVQDKWADASFYDVTLVRVFCALINSAAYAPGPLVMEMTLAATAQIMAETGRTTGLEIVGPLDATRMKAAFNRV